jgi:hypothetical protein
MAFPVPEFSWVRAGTIGWQDAIFRQNCRVAAVDCRKKKVQLRDISDLGGR